MEVIRINEDNIQPNEEPLSISLGDFDGFHLGHQALALESFSRSNYKNAILLLSLSYKRVKTEGEVLSNLDQRLFEANRNRYEAAYILEVSPSFFERSHFEFEEMLRKLGVKEIFIGKDYRYGKDGEGNEDSLKEAGFAVFSVDLKEKLGSKISSSDIKKRVGKGEFEQVTSLMGRPYEVYGKVIHGKQNGRKMGIPTANLLFSSPYALPSFGAYYGRAIVRGIPHSCMISVGNNPTFGGKTTSVEAHLLDFDMDIYDESIYLSFWGKIRENKEFSSMEELRKQLHQDKVSTMEYFSKLK